MSTVRVRVIVFEDGQKIAERDVGYYAGQDYAVEITTPDGVDAKLERKAGEPRKKPAEAAA